MDPSTLSDDVAGLLLLTGTVLSGLGALGLARLPDAYTRAQASAKTSTLGLTFVFAAVAVHFGELSSAAKALGIVLFALLTVPVAAHTIARAAHRAGLPIGPPGSLDELRARDEAAGREDGSPPGPAT